MNLKELAKLHGTNLKQIAERCSIPPSTLYAISSGETNVDNVGIDTFLKISQAMDMTAESLMRELNDEAQINGGGVTATSRLGDLMTDEYELIGLWRRMSEGQKSRIIDEMRDYAIANDAKKESGSRHDDMASIAVMD